MSVSEETKEQVLELRAEGLTYEQIAKKVKIRKSIVGQIVRVQSSQM
jgi:intein-encoded DNA endonuclease-like protein